MSRVKEWGDRMIRCTGSIGNIHPCNKIGMSLSQKVLEGGFHRMARLRGSGVQGFRGARVPGFKCRGLEYKLWGAALHSPDRLKTQPCTNPLNP